MHYLQTLLQELDQLYRSDNLAGYETKWQSVAEQREQAFPGFTIAYAELYNSGTSRLSDGSMRHVLVPQPPDHRAACFSLWQTARLKHPYRY